MSLRTPVSAGLAAVMITLSAALPAGPAQARDRAAAVAAGAVGGLALGAILGGALAGPPPPVDYGPPPPRRVYAEPEDCGYRKVRVYDEDGEFAGFKRVPAC